MLAALDPHTDESAYDDHDLKDIATYVKKGGVNIYDLLRDQFTISKISEAQETILGFDWRRIYTTNYDDAVEFFRNSRPSEAKPQSFENSYSFEDTLPRKLLPGAVIHLHGFLHKCTAENVMDQLVLSHRSYAEQMAKQSPWWQQFGRDIRSAEAIYFLGYSINDFAVASYLSTNPLLREKCYFVVLPDPDPVTSSRINDYGHIRPIGVTGFAKACSGIKPTTKLTDSNSLRAFRFLDPFKDKKTPTNPTPIEIQTLFALGKLDTNRLLSTYPEAKYVIPRSEDIQIAADLIERNKSLIVHSRIGNGKSIFRQCLALQLSDRFQCFVARENVTISAREIEFLLAQKRPLIVFQDYDTAHSVLNTFREIAGAANIVLEIDTGTLQVRHEEVFATLPRPIGRIDINRLREKDKTDLSLLLNGAGIAPEGFDTQISRARDMRDVVLSLYNNQTVAKKIENLVRPIIEHKEGRRLLNTLVILKSFGAEIDPVYVATVAGVDPYSVLSDLGEPAFDLFDFDLDTVEPHSALLSEYICKKYVTSYDLIDWLFKLAAEAARQKSLYDDLNAEPVRKARKLISLTLRYSKLSEILGDAADRDQQIDRLYELGRDNSHLNAEPLFWLQYSIQAQSSGNLDLAELHMATAYERANATPGFKTYQLDTYSFNLYLDLEIRNYRATTIDRYEKIVERLTLFNTMLGDGNHRHHVIAVLQKFEQFVQRRKNAIRSQEAVQLVYLTHLIINVLSRYSREDRALLGSDIALHSLERAAGILATIKRADS